MPVGELDPKRQTREDIERIVKRDNRIIDGPWAAQTVHHEARQDCWADQERHIRSWGVVIETCNDLADGRAGLCKRHAAEILLDVHPERDGVGDA